MLRCALLESPVSWIVAAALMAQSGLYEGISDLVFQHCLAMLPNIYMGVCVSIIGHCHLLPLQTGHVCSMVQPTRKVTYSHLEMTATTGEKC